MLCQQSQFLRVARITTLYEKDKTNRNSHLFGLLPRNTNVFILYKNNYNYTTFENEEIDKRIALKGFVSPP